MRARILVMALALAALPQGAVSSAPAGKPSPPLEVKSVTLGIRHRVFSDFGDRITVKMHEPFRVGDSEYSGEVVQFLAEFDYDIKNRRARSRSNEPKNPAVEVIVHQEEAAQDTTWAFLNMPPHFARKSMLAFQLLRVDFENHAPVMADTAAADTAAGGTKAK